MLLSSLSRSARGRGGARRLRRRGSGAHPASADSFGRVAPRARLVLPQRLRVCVASLTLRNHTTLVDGYLGMSNDEERSEMRYLMRIAEFSESSKL